MVAVGLSSQMYCILVAFPAIVVHLLQEQVSVHADWKLIHTERPIQIQEGMLGELSKATLQQHAV